MSSTPSIVLIPAHNEEASIRSAVESVIDQVDQVVVVADNCTDRTAELAAEAGGQVFATVGNTARKAGALNQALDALLPQWDSAWFLVMDADSTVGDRFIPTAQEALGQDPRLGAVGGVFYGHAPQSWLERAQANEYARYSRAIATRGGRVSVLTGTAAMFRREALASLKEARGFVYDPSAITEDNEVTLALKTLNWQLVSPQACTVWTELMPSLRTLRAQRTRWYRGALDNLLSYGWTPVTRRYWGQQAGLALSSLAMFLYLTVTVWGISVGQVHFSLFWTLVGVLFVVERVVTAGRAGWHGRLLAACLVPEMVYDIFLQLIFLRAVWTVLRRREIKWGHL